MSEKNDKFESKEDNMKNERQKETDLVPIEKREVMGTEMDVYMISGVPHVTRQQVGTALGYPDPAKAIDVIHRRHKERLDKYSVTVKVTATDGKMYETILYSRKGVYEICRWSRQPIADELFDRIYDVLEEIAVKGYYSALPDEVLVQKVVENASDKERLRSVIIPALRAADVLQEDFVTEYMGLKPYDVGGKLGTVSFNNQVAKRTIERWKEFGGKVWSEYDVPERYRDNFHFRSALMSYSRARDNYGKFVKYCGKTYFNKDGYIKVIDGMVKRGNITKEEAAEWKREEKLR